MSVENLCLFKTYREKYLKTLTFKINQLKPLKFKRKLCKKGLSCMILYMFYSRHYRSLQAWTVSKYVPMYRARCRRSGLITEYHTIIKASNYLA